MSDTTSHPAAAPAPHDESHATQAEAPPRALDADPAHDPGDETGDEPAHDPAGEPQHAGYSLTALAEQAGVPARTIRHYQSEKLLPPPERDGRTARYDDRHLERLQLIGRLQERGLSLKAIRDVLRRVEKGKLDIDDWLGIGDQLRRPWSEDTPELLDEDQLAERLAGHHPGLTSELAAHGLIQPNDTLPPTYLVPSPGLLDVALRLEAAGIDVATSAQVLARVEKHLRRAAEDLVEHVVDRAGQGFGQDPDEVTTALAALPQPSLDAVHLVFGREMERALRDRSEALGTALGKRRAKRDDA